MNTVLENTVELCNILKAYYEARHGGNGNGYEYEITQGKKYFKIVQVSNQRSVHAFVDRSNGDIYKAATWNAPAKGVRFNILKDLETLRSRADCFGGYLYR